ncbi:HNH endonuclease [Acinetobacter phage vB_AbaM_B09_Aci05]|uniref:Uncharacterized protein n=1 Tax=Acinetobacter phage vB_AbaM_B09_Aci05 TaxID=2315458 RepID=A0A386KB03_9CAUD|nr:HNH endonuclease [Acinetobacter phage vB_AbaM_B09_Aci05]AYD82359.1 hypothetical protein Aci05_142 [Acinetobacter phage vB_AbaM_B09_Aci05]
MNKRWLNPSTVNGKRTPEYNQWFGMLNRAKKSGKYYENVSVDGRFKDFDWYMEWARGQKGFLKYDGKHLYQIDKDVLGGEVYGPDTCVFVPPQINLLVRGKIKKDDLPLGIYERQTVKSGLVYQCYVHKVGGAKSIGIYKDYKDALPKMLEYYEMYIDWLQLNYMDTVRSEVFDYLRVLYKQEYQDIP